MTVGDDEDERYLINKYLKMKKNGDRRRKE